MSPVPGLGEKRRLCLRRGGRIRDEQDADEKSGRAQMTLWRTELLVTCSSAQVKHGIGMGSIPAFFLNKSNYHDLN